MIISLAQSILKKYHPKIILVVGISSHKGTQNALVGLLSEKYRVARNIVDSFDGIVATILKETRPSGGIPRILSGYKKLLGRVDDYPEYLILSLSLDNHADILRLAQMITCDKLIITDKMLLEKDYVESAQVYEVLDVLSKICSGRIIYNGDDVDFVKHFAKKSGFIRFGFGDENALRANEIQYRYDASASGDQLVGVHFKLMHNGSAIPVSIPGVLGRAHVGSVLAALACAVDLQMPLLSAVGSLGTYRVQPGFFSIIDGIKQSTIIDHSFGISPESVQESLEMLEDIPLDTGQDRFLIIGDIEGLGAQTEEYHRSVGRQVAASRINYLVVVGEKSRDIHRAAREAGMDEYHMFHFADTPKAALFVQERIEKGDLLLVIGPEKQHLELLVKEIMAKPLSAPLLLPRISAEL